MFPGCRGVAAKGWCERASMARTHVDHGDIARFAQDRVNLPREKAKEYRAQARRLRERLESYLKEHPDFTLRKMLL